MKISAPTALREPLHVPRKLLMGPGPSNCPANVLQAMSQPMLGHLHAETLKIMDDIKAGIQYVFQTQNAATMCVSGSGHAGLEMALCNLIERNDVVLIATTGHWGMRAADIARRHGGVVHSLDAPSVNRPIRLSEFANALSRHRPRLLFLAQGDSSTGVLQTHLKVIGQLCRRFDCILIVDTVASLGGTEFLMDEWLVDVAYTGSQKVLSAPPGITPISFNDRAIERIRRRKSVVSVYYFDVLLLGQYWNCFGATEKGKPGRIYHHTISTSLLYGLREALAAVCAEGLQTTIDRHQRCARRLQEGLKQDLHLEMFVPDLLHRLPTVNTVKVPKDVDWQFIIQYAQKNYKLEIGGGLGPTANYVFRIGIMGSMNATIENIDLVLKVLHEALEADRLRKASIARTQSKL